MIPNASASATGGNSTGLPALLGPCWREPLPGGRATFLLPWKQLRTTQPSCRKQQNLASPLHPVSTADVFGFVRFTIAGLSYLNLIFKTFCWSVMYRQKIRHVINVQISRCSQTEQTVQSAFHQEKPPASYKSPWCSLPVPGPTPLDSCCPEQSHSGACRLFLTFIQSESHRVCSVCLASLTPCEVLSLHYVVCGCNPYTLLTVMLLNILQFTYPVCCWQPLELFLVWGIMNNAVMNNLVCAFSKYIPFFVGCIPRFTPFFKNWGTLYIHRNAQKLRMQFHLFGS